MALHFVATLLLLALTAASAPRGSMKPEWTPYCGVEECDGTLEDVKYFPDVIEPFSYAHASMYITNRIELDNGSSVKLTLYGEDHVLHEAEEVPLDQPQELIVDDLQWTRQAEGLPIAPGSTTEMMFDAITYDLQYRYYMLDVEFRTRDKKLVMDARMILDDGTTRGGKVDYEAFPGFEGWLEGLEIRPDYVYADTTIEVDVRVGHKVKLTAGARWLFELRWGSDVEAKGKFDLGNPTLVKLGAMSIMMTEVGLPKEPGVTEMKFDIGFRYPRIGKWTLHVLLEDEQGIPLLILFFTVEIPRV